MKKIMILALLTLFAIPTYSVLAAESPASNNTAQTDRAPYCCCLLYTSDAADE